jgi:predicted CoA-binding protein
MTAGAASDDDIRRILGNTRTIALVGASPRPERPSYGVMRFLMARGFIVHPVRPGADSVLGQKAYARLADVPGPVDLVDIFRRSEDAGAVVDEAIAIGIRAVWMQLEVIDDAAARRARAAGLDVVMDRCPAIEIPRLGL